MVSVRDRVGGMWRAVVGVAVVAVGVGAATMFVGRAEAQFDRFADTPTGWWYSQNVSSATITTLMGQGWRPFQIDRSTGGNYDALFVPNTGSYAVSGWTSANVYQGVSPATLAANLSGKRITDLACFDVGGTTFMSATTVPNNTGWGWLYDQTSSTGLVNWMTSNPSQRIIDLNIYSVGGQKRYAGVAVDNTGSNAMSWWWYFNVTPTQVTSALSANNARLIDIEIDTAPTPGNPTPTFACVMVADSPALTGGNWWYYGQTAADVSANLDQNEARLTVMKSYIDAGGTTKYLVAMVDNANAQTRRVRDYMGSRLTDGVFGFELKQIGGPVLAALNQDFAFEPASSLKIVHGSYCIKQCAASPAQDSLSNLIFIGDRCNNDECPDGANCNAGNESLGTALAEMLQQSDNNRTYEIEQRYGRTTLNNYAAGLGLTNTHINHRLGCLCGNPYNSFSCTDATALYEMIGDGTLFNSAWRDMLFSRMLNLDGYGWGLYPTLNQMITDEAAATDLTASEISDFRARVRFANKGGSYTCGSTYYKPDCGWAELPFKTYAGPILGYLISPRDYALAVFVHANTHLSESGLAYTVKEEILREQVRAALQSWDAACTTSTVTNQPDHTAVVQTHNTSLIIASSGTVENYQWQRSSTSNGVYGNVSNVSGHISGATGLTLSFTDAVPSDAGYYRCRLTSDCATTYSLSAHLTVTGCTADFDDSGSVTVQDIFAFLNAWFAGSPSANVNGGVLSVQDIFDFLNAWFAGC